MHSSLTFRRRLNALALSLAVAGLGAASNAFAEPVSVSRATEMRADRFVDAAVVGNLAAGQKVESLKTEAGWVQVQAGAVKGWVRAMAVQGSGAAVATVARVESGRSGTGNVLSTTGIRSVPRASRHALLVGEADEAARALAADLGVAGGNLNQIEPRANALREALRALGERVRPGDRLLLQLTGAPAAAAGGNACGNGWRTADGSALPWSELAGLVAPLAARLDKLVVFTNLQAAPDCAQAQTRELAAALAKAEVAQANLVVLGAASRPGATATPVAAWRECLAGGAVDTDGNGALNVNEVTRCAQDRLGAGGQIAAAGNTAFTPGAAAGQRPAAATGPRPSDLLAQIHAQRDGVRALSVQAEPRSLRIDKDPLRLIITSPRDGYLYIALAGSDGQSLYLLYPNAVDTDNHVKANTSLILPRPHWRVVAGGPAGTDTLLVMVADQPRDLRQLAGQAVGPFVKPLLNGEGQSQLQWLLGQSENSDQAACQQGGKSRNADLVRACSDAFASLLVQVEERAE